MCSFFFPYTANASKGVFPVSKAKNINILVWFQILYWKRILTFWLLRYKELFIHFRTQELQANQWNYVSNFVPASHEGNRNQPGKSWYSFEPQKMQIYI